MSVGTPITMTPHDSTAGATVVAESDDDVMLDGAENRWSHRSCGER
jgi:hypothetical protein